jgi:hypothetical protein
MAASLTDGLLSQLQGQPLAQIAGQLGLPQGQAQEAAAAALPMLIGMLGHNATQPGGAAALHAALQNDHAGLDIGSVLGSVLGGGGAGGQILGHIFGGQQSQANQTLGRATGLGSDQAGMLLKILAPIVMAYLANHMFGQNQSAAAPAAQGTQSSADVLGQVPGQETQQIGQSGAGGLLGAVLGQVTGGQGGALGDLLKMGGSILGGGRT